MAVNQIDELKRENLCLRQSLKKVAALEKIHTDLIKAQAIQIETTENLYAAATKALNSQLEINTKLQADIGRMAKQIEEQRTELELHRWMLADAPPSGKINWGEKILVLEYDSKTPTVMTMAEVFLNEGSEAEYWKPLILPEKALKDPK